MVRPPSPPLPAPHASAGPRSHRPGDRNHDGGSLSPRPWSGHHQPLVKAAWTLHARSERPRPFGATAMRRPIMSMTIRSGAFAEGRAIPRRDGEDGEDLSPPLTWSGLPEGTRELALIVEDPDAPRP